MKKVIAFAAVCMLVVSCSGPKGDTGATGPVGPSGPETPGIYYIRIFQQGVYSATYTGQCQASIRDTYGGPVYLDSSNPIGIGEDGATGAYRAIIKFDISSLPREKIIVDKAELIVKTNSNIYNVGASGVTVHKVTNTWTIFEVGWGSNTSSSNWIESGGDFDSRTMTTSASYNFTANSTYTIGLEPEVVLDWMKNPETNYGMLMRVSNEFAGNYSEIYSSGALDSSNRPMLKIWYYTTE